MGFFLKPTSIDECRGLIDRIDDQIYERLTARMEISKEIGFHKKYENYTIDHMDREEFIITRLQAKTGLNHGFVEDIWNNIFSESKRVQNELPIEKKKIKRKWINLNVL